MKTYINEKPIAVLLSMFNGSKYIIEQLQSLEQQCSNDFHVYIRDDGSNDETLKTCSDYIVEKSLFTIIDDDIGNVGVIKSFSFLAEHVKSDYYMFCDQDDIWLSDKINNIYNYACLHEKHKNEPFLVFSDLTPFEDGTSVIDTKSCSSSSFLTNINAPLDINFHNLIFRSSVWGCTTLFNKALCDLAFPCPDGIRYHDSWMAQLAYFSGEIVFYNAKDILYRIHENNNSSPSEIMRKKSLYQSFINVFSSNEKELKRITLRLNQIILAVQKTNQQNSYKFFTFCMKGGAMRRILYFIYNKGLDRKTILLSPTIFRAVFSFRRTS